MRLTTLLLTSVTSLTAIANPSNVDVLNQNWMDVSTLPKDNFYQYANGTWKKNNPIPAAYPSWSTFHVLQEKNQQQIQQIILKAASKPAKWGSIEQKVGDFYFSGMDESRINALGISPLQSELTKIDKIQTLHQLQAEIAHLHQIGVNVLFGFGSMQDFTDSNFVIAAVMQDGLGLPDRDYYLKEDAHFKTIRAAYTQYLTDLLVLAGDTQSNAAQSANSIMAIETSLAKASMSRTEQRDPRAVYHMMSIDEFNTLTPNFAWSDYLSALGQPKVKQLNVAMPAFFKAMNQQLEQVSIEQWKMYFRAHLLSAYAPYLSTPFVDVSFKMTSALTGAKQLKPRWKRVVDTENQALGFAIGKLYVERYFSAKDKQEVLNMVKNIRQVLNQDLQTLPWMTEATRKAASQKLKMMGERIGYPDKWWDYSSLKIDRGPYVLNVMRANAFLVQRDLSKIDKPVDRTEWEMSPQTINAYYNPSMNNINFPTGILQPPFFDPKAPAAVNYGSIGFVIGHEITHGFDDEGAKFDGVGNLHNWWTPEDLTKFKAATDCIMHQFSDYTVADNLHVNGELVVGEATADLGGLTLALRAFHASDAYKHAKTIDGFTPDQQFFLGAAHAWANNTRPEEAARLVTLDPHPPAIYRVNGSMANMPEFKAAFGIPDGSPMINPKPCVIW